MILPYKILHIQESRCNDKGMASACGEYKEVLAIGSGY